MVTFYNIHSQHKKYDNFCKSFLLSLAIYIKWHSYRYTLTHTYIKNYLRSLLVSQGYLFQSKNPHTTRNNNFKQQQWQWEKKIKSQNISIVNKVWKSLNKFERKNVIGEIFCLMYEDLSSFWLPFQSYLFFVIEIYPRFSWMKPDMNVKIWSLFWKQNRITFIIGFLIGTISGFTYINYFIKYFIEWK